MLPHAGQPVITAGAPLGQGKGVIIAVHGRGAGPANILDLVPRLGRSDFTFIAPAAAGRSWYPHGFMEPIERNEPGLSSALQVLHALVESVAAAGMATEKIVLLGFSQGACLASTEWNYPGSFAGTPVFLGSSDIDTHVPKVRVDETADIFRRMGASVDERIYPGMAHTINDDEIAAARGVLDSV
jgi:predicted esterase